jgi:hypothetical protein
VLELGCDWGSLTAWMAEHRDLAYPYETEGPALGCGFERICFLCADALGSSAPLP